MARVPYIRDEDASPVVAQMFAAINEGFGRVGNNSRLIANTPHILPWHIGLVLSVKSAGTGLVDAQLKNLIILRVSALNSCDYCVYHNEQYGAAVGTDSGKVGVVSRADWAGSGLFSPRERAALEWAEKVSSNTAARSAECFDELKRHFTDREIVEITFIAAHRTMQNLIQEALLNDIEGPDVASHAAMPAGFLARYAREVVPEVVAGASDGGPLAAEER